MGSSTSEEQKTENIPAKVRNTPKQYVCPLSHKIMAHPMMIPMTGIVYDKITLAKWFKQYSCDPMTGIDQKCAPKQNKIILNPRKDIEARIKLYLDLYPQKKKDQITEMSEIKWKEIFETRINDLQQRQNKFRTQDILIKYKSYPLFQKSEINIEKNELFIQQNVPIISFMGPNRCGKSTLLNDIMRQSNIFGVSHDPMHSCTQGAHISQLQLMNVDPCLTVKYWLDEIVKLPQYFFCFVENGFNNMTKIAKITQQDLIRIGITNTEHQIKLITNQLISVNDVEKEGKSEEKMEDHHDGLNGIYLLDVEGSSHQVTEFTTKMFYAVYAISNVIVWNDIQIADDRFGNLMKKIKENMKSVAESPRKPIFVYLKRDHSNFGFGDYDKLDDYIQKDDAWKWLHDMNLFRSIRGYQIAKRPSRDAMFPEDTLNSLVSFLSDLTPNSQRFVQSDYELDKQLTLINKIGRIDTGMEKIYKSFVLDGLLFDDDEIVKCGQVLRYAEYFKWDTDEINKSFQEADQVLQKMINEHLIDEDIRIKLMVNKEIVVKRIQQMNETDREEMYISPTSVAAVGFVILALLGGVRLFMKQ